MELQDPWTPTRTRRYKHDLRRLNFAADPRRLVRQTVRRRHPSDQPDLLEFGFDDVLVERLHDVLVRTGMQRACDVCDVVLGGAEHDLGTVPARQAPQRAQEFVAIHLRHVPVEQHRVGELALAGGQRLLAVLRLRDLEIQSFQDPPRHLADHARVVDHETGLHDTHVLCWAGEPGPTRALPRLSVSFAAYAATASLPPSKMRSTSSTTSNCFSSRCTPDDTRARCGSRLTGTGSRLFSASLRTSPTESMRRP